MQACLEIDIDGELRYGHWRNAFEMVREVSGRCALRPMPAAEIEFGNDDLSNFAVIEYEEFIEHPESIGDIDDANLDADLDIDAWLSLRREITGYGEPP